jgi:hypothetical protein
MAYSLKPDQETCVQRVLYFIARQDEYNAKEALKDVESPAAHTILTNRIKEIV